jgi:hypothetical protein
VVLRGAMEGFSEASAICLLCSSAEEGERMQEILKIENGGSPLKCVMLRSSRR